MHQVSSRGSFIAQHEKWLTSSSRSGNIESVELSALSPNVSLQHCFVFPSFLRLSSQHLPIVFCAVYFFLFLLFVVAKPSTGGNVCLKWRRHNPSYQKKSLFIGFLFPTSQNRFSWENLNFCSHTTRRLLLERLHKGNVHLDIVWKNSIVNHAG